MLCAFITDVGAVFASPPKRTPLSIGKLDKRSSHHSPQSYETGISVDLWRAGELIENFPYRMRPAVNIDRQQAQEDLEKRLGISLNNSAYLFGGYRVRVEIIARHEPPDDEARHLREQISRFEQEAAERTRRPLPISTLFEAARPRGKNGRPFRGTPYSLSIVPLGSRAPAPRTAFRLRQWTLETARW